MSPSGEPHQKWNSWNQLMQENPQAQRSSSGVVLNRLALRPKDGPQTSKPEGWSSSGSAPRRETMPAIASLEDLKAAQKDLCYSMRVCLKRSDPQVKRSSSDSDPLEY